MDTGLLKTLQGFKITSRSHRKSDDDFVDRLNYYYSAILISIFSIIITAKQYVVGDPLQCWVPAQFPGAWEQYAENFCWVRNTYFVDPKDPFPEPHQREATELQYYQWVPFVLAIQAFMFYVPIVFWRICNWQSGACVKNVVCMASDANNIDPDARDKNMKILAKHILATVFYDKVERLNTFFSYLSSQKSQFFLVITYLFTKLLFILNIILQFALLNEFLGPDYHTYGWRMIQNIRNGNSSWEDTGHFPHVTYCDFRVRDLGQPRSFTVQCVLVINLFNEKIYFFLWFWFVGVLIVNIYSFLRWSYDLLLPGRKKHEVKKFLQHFHSGQYNLNVFDDMINRMTRDALFELSLVKANCGEIMAGEVVSSLYKEILGQNPQELPFQDRPPSYRKRDGNAPIDSSESSEQTPMVTSASV